jgi:hypothetical protein
VSDGDLVADLEMGVFEGVADWGDRDTDVDFVTLFVGVIVLVSERDGVTVFVGDLVPDGERVTDLVPLGVFDGLLDAFGVLVTDLVPVGVLVVVLVSVTERESDLVTEIVLVGDLLFAANNLGSSFSVSSRLPRRRRRTVGGRAPKKPPTNSSWLKSENRFSPSLYVVLRALCSLMRA